MEIAGHAEGRARFAADLGRLRGRRVLAVEYWDLHDFSDAAPVWDYGGWHHAVMGVQLTTDQGPVTITWTDTWSPYGVEALYAPITDHLVLGEEGPRRVGPDPPGDAPWIPRLGSPIRDAVYLWTRFEVGPGRRADGTPAGPARHEDIPTALRLGFDAGPVWFVAAIPQWPEMTQVFVPGDEIMVVFSEETMRDIGLEDV